MTEPVPDAVAIARQLSRALSPLRFGAPITHVYNPLEYAWAAHEAYLRKYAGAKPREVVMMGMNPGPWGMAQTGVPFGDVCAVRDWLGICAPISRPCPEHPKRPVTGFDCKRSEVSGSRVWGWAQARFRTPDRFFQRFYIHNYCPLSFMEESGRNFTPDKLRIAEREPLLAACDEALRQLIALMRPKHVVGIGHFAEGRLRKALEGQAIRISRIPHPSPASPAANRDWAGAVEAALREAGIML